MRNTARARAVQRGLRRCRPILLSIFLVPGGSACSADAGPETGTGGGATVSDSSGVEIVTNSSTTREAELAWQLEPDLQVGEIDGPLAFGRINWVSPIPGRGMLVLDGQSHLAHVFDSAGRHVRQFGGEGDGPGEFRRPGVITPVEGGRVAVAQTFPPVLHWLSLEGEYEGTTRLPSARSEAGTQTAGTFGLWQVTPAGRVFAQAQVIDPAADGGEMPAVLMEISPDGSLPPDTISRWTWQSGAGDGPMRMFDAIPTWMPRADGTVVLAPGAPYEYREHDPATGLLRIVRREVDRTPVTARHRELVLAEMRENMENSGTPADFIDQWLDRIEFESVVPDVMRVWVSEPDGRVWLGVYDPVVEEEAGEPTGIRTNAWDVFEPGGAYLGRIPVPAGFRLTVVTDDALYGVWEDDLEVPFARRYRIVREDGIE